MNCANLPQVMVSMARNRSLTDVLSAIVSGIAQCQNVVLARLWLIQPGDICEACRLRPECPDQERCLHLVASAGNPRDKTQNYSRLDGAFRRFPLGVRKIGRVGKSGEPLLLPDLRGDEEWIADPDWLRREQVRTFAGQPLVFRDEVLGVLAIFDATVLGQADFDWLRVFADHAAVSIANARAFEEIEFLKARLEEENAYLRQEVTSALGVGDFVGTSPGLRKVMQQIQLVAPTEAAVLVTGESGTGKELVARAIHEHSPRRGRALIKVNCSAVPEALFESEFFGHVKGAFTGALRDKPGRFELADGGTLFLDEIGEVPLPMQAKLLRVLQEQEIERVGDTRTRKVSVRIIAATNRDLKAEVAAGRFRQDLFYRLSVFPIELPPLRERRDDIPPLTLHFVQQSARRLNRPAPRVTQGTMAQLSAHDWPGNIRELQNAVERAVILSSGGPLRFELTTAASEASAAMPTPVAPAPALLTRDDLKRQERETIAAALKQTDGKIFGAGGAAELLGMKPTTLASRLKALGLKRKGA
ncbi:MAG TPA: sigma 54-interacting transcriptional regulator [Candidatus Limnocylindria bacterium]|nr:sigma 54-interacting transcriptional regulator [Candidatus Limnocylindria bacterium]